MSAATPSGRALTSRCTRCGTAFECGVNQSSCWCQALPALEPARFDAAAGCYCPGCLAELVRAQTGETPACGSNANV